LAGYGRGICHFNSVKNPIKAATGGTFHMPLVAGTATDVEDATPVA
jgi:hypothetical protein